MKYSNFITLAAGLTLASASASAQTGLVTDRGAITGSTLSWFEIFGLPNRSVTGSATAVVDGVTVAISSMLPGFVYSQQQYSWVGNFNPGDEVLTSQVGPIEFTFDTDIFAFGSNVQSMRMPEAFTGTISAFDIFGNEIASYSRQGMSTWLADGSAIFLGISSDVGIRRIVMEVDGSGIAMNQAIFGSLAPVEAPPTWVTLDDFGDGHEGAGDVPVLVNPEPGTVVLLSAGMLVLGAAYRRRRSVSTELA